MLSDETRHRLKWGWLRLFLAILQLSLAPMALGSLIMVGLRPVTWILIFGATMAMVVSRLLYRGRSDPHVEEKRRR